MKVPTGSSAEIEYPSSDGQPMSENQWQLDAMIDPVGRYLAPPLQGFRLHGGDYHPLLARPVGGAPVLRSDALRLDLRDARPVGRHAHGSSAHSGGCFGRAIFDPRRRCAASLDQEVT